jgi:hypothetical protein
MGPVNLDGTGEAAGPCQDVGIEISGPVIVRLRCEGTGGGPIVAFVQSVIATTRGGFTLTVGHGQIEFIK